MYFNCCATDVAVAAIGVPAAAEFVDIVVTAVVVAVEVIVVAAAAVAVIVTNFAKFYY